MWIIECATADVTSTSLRQNGPDKQVPPRWRGTLVVPEESAWMIERWKGGRDKHVPPEVPPIKSHDDAVFSEIDGMSALPSRKRPIHVPPIEKPSGPIIVFITVCTHRRKRILAQPDVRTLLLDCWRKTPGWTVGRYVIMPDHIHLFCAPLPAQDRSLEDWMRRWKSAASRRWPRPEEHPVWQRSFWDRQLRTNESYDEKWEYVRNNPVRAGLVQQADDWPFAGELCFLEW